jgi:23S rRNA (guanosine2251-2'-O)-methyltransferase
LKEWITGRNPVYEVLRARRRHVFRLLLAEGIQEKGRVTEILELARKRKIQAGRASRQALEALGENSQGVALEASAYPYATLTDILERASARNETPLILCLDLIQNPQNLGSLLRSAEIFGAHGALLPLARAAGVTPAVVSASAGASEHLLIATANLAQAIQELKQAGVWVFGLEGTPQAQPPEELRLDGPLALVVGNEGEGMRPLVRRSCDFLMRLPMAGQIDSLNAAVAGSIALYLAAQARRDTHSNKQG